MELATRQVSPAMRRPTSCYMRCLFSLLITMATMNTLALADPPSSLVVYVHRKYFPPNETIVTAASPSGNPSVTEFGTIFVVQDVVRETEAPDSLILGSLNGQIAVEKDGSIYLSVSYAFNSPSFVGTVSFQGVSTFQGGELAITGGTEDFRWARGYGNVTVVFQDPQVRVLKAIFTIKYD